MDTPAKKKMGRPMVNDSAPGSRTSARAKAPIWRRDTRFEQLEALHKSSETGSRLRIPDGKHIKLSHDYTGGGIQPASRTMKKVPKSDIDFSVLEEHDGVTSETRVIELSDSDELPDFHELVRDSVRSAGEADEGLVSHASDYSDSDMDALILSAHLDGVTSTGGAVSINARTRASTCTRAISPSLRTQVCTHKSCI
jgi:hypothetical protein